MNKKKILVLLLTFLMAFQPVLPVLATGEETGVTENTEAEAVSEEDVEWLSEDFTYTEMSKTLYGCDYTRQFTITGQAISGFSESGLEKLEKTTDLVIPSTDTEGNKLVGIADDAFREKGLTSVTFPTGMMVDYDDTITHAVTRRGNFIIGASAFYKNNLTEVTLPEGVIAVLPNAFMSNQLKKVSLPHTIWWIETQSFAQNELTTVGFPKTCDFQLEIHGMPFVQNNIRWVRLPDYVEVVNKHAFYFNPGMEDCPDNAPDDEKEKGGVVYMYTDNAALAKKDRIHHIEKTAETQHSWHQKLIVETAPDGEWTADDFTYEGTTITGFSESGILKRVANSDLVLPDKNTEGDYVTAIADAQPGGYGLFAEEDIQFDSLTLPAKLEKIGAYAFQNNGLDTIKEFPNTLKEIGNVAFQTNDLKSVILPDSVTDIGQSAFSQNVTGEGLEPSLTKLTLGTGVKTIGKQAFEKSVLTEVTIPEGLETLDANAFKDGTQGVVKVYTTNYEHFTSLAESTYHELSYIGEWGEDCFVVDGTTITGLSEKGKAVAENNKEMTIPSTINGVDVTAIGENAFENLGLTKATLLEKLETIGKAAFAGNKLTTVDVPDTMKEIAADAFSGNGEDVQLVVYADEAYDNLKDVDYTGAVLVDKTPADDTNTDDDTDTDDDTNTDNDSDVDNDNNTDNSGSINKDNNSGNNKTDSDSNNTGSSKAVKTGDTNPVLPLGILAMVSLGAIVAVVSKKRSL